MLGRIEIRLKKSLTELVHNFEDQSDCQKVIKNKSQSDTEDHQDPSIVKRSTW